MKTITPAFRSHLDQTVTTLTTLWKIVRKDGIEFYFTDHDVDIPFDDGDGLQDYISDAGYDRTAIANKVGLSVSNLDISGFLNSKFISAVDLKAGLFDYASVYVRLVNWKDLGQGALKLRRGHIGEVSLSHNGQYSAELRGLSSDLSQTVIDQYQPECRTDLGSKTCQIPTNPPPLGRSSVVALGDIFKVVTASTSGVSWDNVLYNPDFEQGVLGISTTVDKWSVETGSWDVTATIDGLAPSSGSQFLRGGSVSGTLAQRVDLSLIGVDLTSIDAGTVTSSFSIQRANTDVGDTGRVVVSFLDSSGTLISGMYDTTIEQMSPVDTWISRSATAVAVPANCRFIEIVLTHTVSGTGSSCFDDCSLTLNDTAAVNSNQDIYENRIYEVTTAGTTNATQPIYDTTVGNTTTDGTAVLTAKDSWTRHAVINDVVDFYSLAITVSDSRAIAGWFSHGVVRFESGKNKGVVQEVKNWSGTDGSCSLFLPTPFPIVPGTKITIWPGCDKGVGTCHTKFDNVINFQAEPFVPGEDLLSRFSSLI